MEETNKAEYVIQVSITDKSKLLVVGGIYETVG